MYESKRGDRVNNQYLTSLSRSSLVSRNEWKVSNLAAYSVGIYEKAWDQNLIFLSKSSMVSGNVFLTWNELPAVYESKRSEEKGWKNSIKRRQMVAECSIYAVNFSR